jgi:GntR family transcriptional regulator/MocR family aminotransferase
MDRAGSAQSSWASSPDLLVARRAGGGRRAALERALRTAIRSGRLRPGERLPSTRALAHDLGLARGTVAEAYAQLAAEGWLRTRPGAPTRVAPELRTAPDPPRGAPPAGAPPAPRFDLRVGVPDVGAFPRAAWLRALRRSMAAAPDDALRIYEARGRPELRTALAAYLGRTRGVLADPEQIVVCSGFTQGLAILSRALREAGARAIAMEDPCVAHLRAIPAGAGLRVLALPVDDDGARLEVPAGAGAAVVTPAHQFPLGATLPAERRAALVRWARDYGTVVVEDDYDGEFRYDRQPVGALQGLDPEHVVYAGTASKTLAPGLRLGWLVLPRGLVEPVLAARQVAGGDTATLEQLTLAELLESGGYDRHVRRMRQRYRRRRDLLLALLGGRVPGMRTRGVAAGLHVVLELPAGGPAEAEVLARAAERSLALHALGPYWHVPRERPQGLVLGYAAPPEHTYAQTLAALGDVLV